MKKLLKHAKLLTLLLTTSSLLLTTGCATASNTKKPEGEVSSTGTPLQGGIVRTTLGSEPDNLDPHLSAAADTEAVMNNVFEGLIGFTATGELVPRLCSSYTVSDDGLVYTFTLRDDVRFHNGNPMTAEDVIYSYSRLAGLNGEEPLSSKFQQVTSIEKKDDTTIVFTLSESATGFLSACTEAVVPANYTDQATAPIGTGPFKFSSYIPGQHITLDTNTDYYDTNGKPYIDQIVFNIMSDPSSILMALKSDRLDMGQIDTINAGTLTNTFTIIDSPQNMVQVVAFNHEAEPFNDVRVRQAINYAINKDLLIEGVGNGFGTKVYSHASPVMSFWYNDLSTNEPYPYNPERAKALLAEAGFGNGFETTIKVPSNYQFHIDTAQILADMLKEVGITLNIELIEWGQWLETVYNGRNYETTIIGLAGKLDPHDTYIRYTTGFDKNFYNYSSVAYDKLIAEANKLQSSDTRATLYKDAQKLLADDAVALYIMDPPLVYASKPQLQGYTPYPAPYFDASKLYYVAD